jgi:hypothetical protein
MGGFDVQVHTRGMQSNLNGVGFMEAGHGSACDAPPATHSLTMAEMTVFRCKDHVMTAIRADDYGVIYLTPDRMLDWSDGEAVLRVDVSTQRTSPRDWWDLWLVDWDANIPLPLESALGGVDLQGPPNGDYVQVHMDFAAPRFFAESDNGPISSSDTPYQASSPTQRDTFELRINGSTFSFCKPDENLCWVNNRPHGLNVTQAVVKLGHHSYNPTKDGQPNTWHWDNLYMSDSVPFTIIRANQRIKKTTGEFTFNQPAPAGSYLSFSAVGRAQLDFGQGFVTATPGAYLGFEEHWSPYLVPIPAGTTTVKYRGADDGWYKCSDGNWGCAMKDVSILSQ